MLNLKTATKNLKLYYLATSLFLLPTYLIRFKILDIPTTLLEILIYLGVIWSLFYLKDWKKLKQIPILTRLAVLLFVLSAMMGVLVSPDKITALGHLKGFIIDPLLLIILIYLWVPAEKISTLYQSLVASGVGISLLAIYQKLAGIATTDGRILSVWQYDPHTSPNYLSLFLMPIAVLVFTRLFQGSKLCSGLLFQGSKLFQNSAKKFKKPLTTMLYSIVVLVVILTGIYLSGSRGGLLAFAAGISYFTLKTLWHPKGLPESKWLTVGLILIIMAGIFLAGRPDFSASPNSGRISSSNNIRWQIWRVTVKKIIPSHWLAGVGLGNFQNYFTQLTADRVNFPEFIAPKALTPHNLFLTLWVNGGIIMLGSFLLLLYLLYSKGDQNLLTEKSVMLGILIYGLVDTPFLKNDLSVLVWLIFIAYVVKTIQKQVAD